MELGVVAAVIIGIVIGGILVVSVEKRKFGDPRGASLASSAAPNSAKNSSVVESSKNNPLVRAEHIFISEPLATRDDVLTFISARAVELGMSDDAEALMQAFLKRESDGSTAMMDGFAIPHAKTDAVKDAGVIVVKTVGGISAWEGMDAQPVTCAIALLAPESHAGTTHIRLLSQVAQALMDEDFRAHCKAESDPEAIAAAINERLS